MRTAAAAAFPLVVLSILLVPRPSLGQEQGGAIEGVVTDASGARVPGATVQLTGASGVAVEAATSVVGAFRFPTLAPGHYDLVATLPGFRPATVKGIVLSLGQVLTLRITLEVAAVTEQVEVTATSPLIDVKQSSAFADLGEALIDRLPKARDFSSLVTMAPGARFEPLLGGISIDGATGAENRFVIDGMDTTNLVFGQSGKPLVTDFVQEVQVKSSGYAAEFGGATGGVINVITRSGTNTWRGSALMYLSSDRLNGPARPILRISPVNDTVAEYVTFAKDRYTTSEPGGSFGGPIVRNRLFFFASYVPSLQTTHRTVTFLTDGSTATFARRDRTHFFTGNVSAQFSAGLRARVAVNLSPYAQAGELPARDGSGSPSYAYADQGQTRPNRSVSGNVDWVVGKNLLIAARGGYLGSNHAVSGVPNVVRYVFSRTNATIPGIPADLVRPRGYRNVTTNATVVRDVQTRVGAEVTATRFTNWLGEHAVKGGVQVERLGADVFQGNQQANISLFWGESFATTDGRRVAGPYGYFAVSWIGWLGKVHTTNVGLFLQDRWTVGTRLTLNVGVRTERERVPSFSDEPGVPETALAFDFRDKLAPRLGFSYDLTGDGRTKLYGSWGLFYDITKMFLAAGGFGGYRQDAYYYTLDTYDWTTLGTAPGCPPTCSGGTFIERFRYVYPYNDPTRYGIDPNLKPMRSQELALGADDQLGPNLTLGVRYVHKQVDRAIEDQGVTVTGVGSAYMITNPGFGIGRELIPGLPLQPKAVRDYDSLEFRVSKRLAARWMLTGSYQWSRLYGNYNGLVSGDGVVPPGVGDLDSDLVVSGQVAPNLTHDFDDLGMSFDQNGRPTYGRLPADRPHQLRVQGVYQFVFGTTAGVNLYGASGTPIARNVNLYPSVTVYPLGRMSEGRTPSYWQTDLFLQHEFDLGGKRRLQLSANIANLFDRAAAVFVFPFETQGQLAMTTAQYLNGVDIEQAIAEQKVKRDPRFLQPTLYQAPRAIRLGVRVTF